LNICQRSADAAAIQLQAIFPGRMHRAPRATIPLSAHALQPEPLLSIEIRHRRFLPLLIAGLATIGPFAIDTYLPSFPAIALEMNTTEVLVQQTLTAYLLPFAVMMLFHGAISDAVGRRPVILVGIGGFVLASIGCALATNMTMLLICRALQGLVAGASTSLSRAVVRDAYQGVEAQRLMSRVMMIFSIAPAIAPIIGGWLQTSFGWRANFWFLALFGAVLLVACYRYLPETLAVSARQRFAPAPLLAAYRLVAFNPRFLLLAGVSSLSFAGFFLYVLSAPAFIYRHLGLTAHDFAWLFMAGVIGMMLGAFLSGRLAGKISPRRTIWLSFAIMFAGAAYNNLFYLWFSPQLPWSVVHQVIYATGMAMAMPSLTLMLLDLFPHNRGMAASLQGCVQSMTSGFVAAIASPLFSTSAATMALGGLLFAVAALVLWLAYLPLRVRA
jgi:DHA1 family bicyclomycin/chloramphenicol resistance-like MFS transporter